MLACFCQVSALCTVFWLYFLDLWKNSWPDIPRCCPNVLSNIMQTLTRGWTWTRSWGFLRPSTRAKEAACTWRPTWWMLLLCSYLWPMISFFSPVSSIGFSPLHSVYVQRSKESWFFHLADWKPWFLLLHVSFLFSLIEMADKLSVQLWEQNGELPLYSLTEEEKKMHFPFSCQRELEEIAFILFFWHTLNLDHMYIDYDSSEHRLCLENLNGEKRVTNHRHNTM